MPLLWVWKRFGRINLAKSWRYGLILLISKTMHIGTTAGIEWQMSLVQAVYQALKPALQEPQIIHLRRHLEMASALVAVAVAVAVVAAAAAGSYLN